MFSGGAIRHLSLFVLGIMPYISAFVIVQLASVVAPRLRRLAAEGPAGRRALNQYARLPTLVLAGFQAIGVASGLESIRGLVAVPGLLFDVTTVLTLTASAIFLMWLAEQITERGIGDGVLGILAGGFFSHLPFALSTLGTDAMPGYWFLVMLLIAVAVIALVVAVERAVRWIPIHDLERETGIAMAAGAYARLPLRLNPTGILAPLAASVLAGPLWGIAIDLGGRGDSRLERLARSITAHLLVEGL
jgi:preprotein translocase subunit SecY